MNLTFETDEKISKMDEKLTLKTDFKQISKSSSDPEKYHCTNCGKTVNKLFRKFDNSSVISLEICQKCGKNVDSYIEYSTVIKLLDCCLLHPPVYRHLHYNNEGNVKSRIKLFLISIIVESVCKLSVFKDGQTTERFDDNDMKNSKFFTHEITVELLFNILISLASSGALCELITIFSAVLARIGKIRNKTSNKLNFHQVSTIVQQTSPIKIMALPVLIWVEPGFLWIYDNIILMIFLILTTSFIHSVNYDRVARSTVKKVVLVSAFVIYFPQRC